MKSLYTTIVILVAFAAVSSIAYGNDLQFKAELSGDQEVTTPAGGVVSNTTGEIKVEFDEALTQAEFELKVFDGVDVTQAHFHCAPAGVNGPVVAFLFPSMPPADPGVDVDGELAKRTLTNANILPRICGPHEEPVNNIASLFSEMQAGRIYVNVHTVANTGGEVRGQLLEAENDD